MTEGKFIKNITFSEPLDLVDQVAYAPGQVVSRTLAQNEALSITLFAFDQGEGLSGHSAPGDAMVLVLDGRATVTIADKTVTVGPGQVVIMPAQVPHALNAEERFKMLLTVVKPVNVPKPIKLP
jgi:quercetin dioxygenase-like cupin family protein